MEEAAPDSIIRCDAEISIFDVKASNKETNLMILRDAEISIFDVKASNIETSNEVSPKFSEHSILIRH